MSHPTQPFASLDEESYALPRAFVDGLQTPALVIYLDRVRDNVGRMLEYTAGPERWRPHVKTSKIPEVWAELLRAGLRNFKCATTREASVLASVVADEVVEADLLVAYPLRGPGLRRLGEVAAAAPSTKLSVLAEDADVVDEIPEAIDVFVDVNPGMNRTGVPMDDEDAILAVVRAAGERFRGLHFYDGHQHDGDLERRRAAIFAGYARLLELADALTLAGHAPGELVTAGTPAFQHALAFAPFRESSSFVHRVSPGTVVYHDARTEIENPDVDLQPAALVLTRVISHPTAGVATCDAGSKSVAAEAGEPCAHVVGHGELTATAPNEEHLPLRSSGALPPRGSELLLVPHHVCPTVNLAEEAVLVEAGREPRIVRVTARAHELLAPPEAG